MANELDTALKNIATTLAQYVKDASMMQVETRYVEISEDSAVDFDKARPAARTVIKLDGDSETVLPMRKNDAGSTVVDSELFDLHQQNVTTAIEYRARILDALLSNISSAARRGIKKSSWPACGVNRHQGFRLTTTAWVRPVALARITRIKGLYPRNFNRLV
jgi:hypothetical protein